MPLHIFETGSEPTLRVLDCRGDLAIQVWDEPTVEAAWSDETVDIVLQDTTLLIERLGGDLRLRVPAAATVWVERQRGDVAVSGVTAITLSKVDGDVEIEAIAGMAQLHDVQGDVKLENITGMVQLHAIQGDCRAIGIGEALRYGALDGDLKLQGRGITIVVGGQLRGDLTISEVASLDIGDIGGDAEIRRLGQGLRVGSIGGDCTIVAIPGLLAIGAIGGDAKLRELAGPIRVGNIGGDLELDATFPAGSVASLAVAGDARVRLPEHPSLTIQATVGGELHGQRFEQPSAGSFSLVYGEGGAQLQLLVGGDLELQGGGLPESSSAAWSGWAQFGKEVGGLGAELGAELGRMGTQLGAELSDLIGSWGSAKSGAWAQHAEQHAERVRRRVEEHLQHIEQRARRANTGTRSHSSATSSAKPQPPAPPMPTPPASEQQPRPAAAPPAPPVPTTPNIGATIRLGATAAAASPAEASERASASDEERLAILRMVAEGRISPDEAETLLEALE